MRNILFLLTVCTFISGCANATRLLTDAATTGAGGLVAHKLSKGDPLVTAAGAGAGLLLGEGIHFANHKAETKAYSKGFDKGRSDAVKQQYWIMVNQQKRIEDDFSGEISLFDIPLPEHHSGSAIINPTIRSLRIEN